MRTLVVFYSRTGTTKKVGEVIAQKLGADTEEIIDTANRSGAKGFLISGRDAIKRNMTKLNPTAKSPSDYDLVIISTPIWGWNMSVLRTYLTEQKNNFSGKVAFFCTMGGSGDSRAFKEMGEIVGKQPIGNLALKTVEVVKNNFSEQLEKFLLEVK